MILPFCFRRFFFSHRVWEGILGIPRDLTKIQSGMWENVRFVDRVRDLTATQGERSRFTKILGKNGIRERDDRSVGFGFDLTKKWESGIREVTRLSRSIFPRWSKEQVIVSDETIFKNVPNESLLSPQKFISKKC